MRRFSRNSVIRYFFGHLYCMLSRVDEKYRKFSKIPLAPGIKEWRSLRQLS